jgi:hypothetical protein
MLHLNGFAACVFVVLLLGCTSVNGPAINMDNDGMQSLKWPGGAVHVSGFRRDIGYALQSSVIGQFKARLFIGTDRNVKKMVFVEGSKGNWMVWRDVLRHFEFTFSPDALPGPWEVDLLVKTRPPDDFIVDGAKQEFPGTVPKKVTSYIPVAYRTAKQQ